jgi:hypothetical protein
VHVTTVRSMLYLRNLVFLGNAREEPSTNFGTSGNDLKIILDQVETTWMLCLALEGLYSSIDALKLSSGE